MHFNFHLDGNESPEKLRRIANAVLALGGVAHSGGSTNVGELTADFNVPRDVSKAIAERLEQTVVNNKAGEFRIHTRQRSVAPFPDTELSTGELVGGVEANAEEGREFVTFEELKTATANAVAGDSKRDVNGLPWDERIHSSSRAVNADGSWRAKRGVDPGLVAAVEDELRAFAVHEAVSALIPPAPPAAASLLVPPTPPTPPANDRSYADVVNIIMSKKLSPEVYVAVLGESLPDFAKTVKANPAVADEMYEKLAGL